jgi:flagellar assembly factor FliW
MESARASARTVTMLSKAKVRDLLRVVAGTHFEPQIVESPVLGRLAVEPARVVEFLEAIAGFPTCTRYALLPYMQRNSREDAAMRWLQALEAPYHTFIVADPWSVHPDYEPEIADSDARRLENLSLTDATFYGIMTVARGRGELTINLRAPLVVNAHLRLGKQVVLLNGEYTTSHRVCELP